MTTEFILIGAGKIIMRKLLALLVVSLGLLLAVDYRLRQQVQRIQAVSKRLSDQVGAPDPRAAAATLKWQVTKAEQSLAAKLGNLSKLIPPRRMHRNAIPSGSVESSSETATSSESNATNDSTAKQAYLASEAEQTLRGRIGFREIQVLLDHLDPERTPLPNQVTLYRDAMLGWTLVRRKWSEPAGRRELDRLAQIIGYPPSLIELLDLSVPDHMAFAEQALRTRQIPAEFLLTKLEEHGDRLGKYPRDTSNARFVRIPVKGTFHLSPRTPWKEYLRRSLNSSETHRNLTLLDSIERSGDFDSKAWTEQIASSRHTKLLTLEALQTWAMWNWARSQKQRVVKEPLASLRAAGDESIEPYFQLLTKLKANQTLPRTHQSIDIDAARFGHRPSILDEMGWANPVARPDENSSTNRWLLDLTNASLANQRELLDEWLMLHPDDHLRPQVLTAITGFDNDAVSFQTQLNALACRWATVDDLDFLVRQATMVNRNRASLDNPDVTAEAITRLCELSQESPHVTSRVAQFWLQQPRWPRAITRAWIGAGAEGEKAILTALAADAKGSQSSNIAGLQRAMDVLAEVGKHASQFILSLEGDNPMLPRFTKSDQPTADRFIRFALSRIERRLSRKPESDKSEGQR